MTKIIVKLISQPTYVQNRVKLRRIVPKVLVGFASPTPTLSLKVPKG
jgi:hypothetical protein